MIVDELERRIAAIRDGGWDGIESAFEDRARTAGARPARALSEEDRRTIAAAWAAFYATPEGRKAIEALYDRTIGRVVYPAHYGWNAEQVAIFGAHREGQNFVVDTILNQIALAREEPQQQRD